MIAARDSFRSPRLLLRRNTGSLHVGTWSSGAAGRVMAGPIDPAAARKRRCFRRGRSDGHHWR